MSKINHSADHFSLPGVQQVELSSPFTPENIKELCDNDSKNFPLFDKEYFSCSQNRGRSDSSPHPERDENIVAPDNTVILNHSRLTTKRDRHDQVCVGMKSTVGYVEDKEKENAHSSKTYPSPDFSHFDEKKKNNEVEVADARISKTNTHSLHSGHVLHKKQNSSSLRTKNVDNFNESFLTSQNGTFLRKQIASSTNTSGNTQPTQVKTKLRSLWNNMKYGWRVKREVNLKLDSATWLLGLCYHNKQSDDCITQDATKEFKLDLLSKIWLTYRINFPMIPGTDFISDSGWGCMLRCGQMMMAQALVCHFLHRDWRISFDQPDENKYVHKMILRWFGDTLSEKSPFSIHHLVSRGVNYGRKAGDWYGPTHAAQVLRDSLIQAKKNHPEMKHLSMYVALDGIVFKQDVFDLCSNTSDLSECGLPVPSKTRHLQSSAPNLQFPQSSVDKHLYAHSNSLGQNVNVNTVQNYGLCDCDDSLTNNMSFVDTCPSYSEFGPPSFSTVEPYWNSLILFVSVRLGNDKMNPFYIPCLKSLLAYENCIGIIGGRPKHALYFIGWQEDKLIHMDPHSCQPVIDVETEDFNEKSFHSASVRTISFNEMDPSCAIGFYFRKREEFQHFIDKFSEITAPMKKNLDYPVFALAEGKRIDVEEVDSHQRYARSSVLRNSKVDEDDYILL